MHFKSYETNSGKILSDHVTAQYYVAENKDSKKKKVTIDSNKSIVSAFVFFFFPITSDRSIDSLTLELEFGLGEI